MKFKARPYITILFALFFLILHACKQSDTKTTTTAQQTASAKPPPMAVEIFIATPTLINEKIEVPGSLQANETTEIHPEISGRLVRLNIAEGKFVSRGSLLAKIYDGDLQAQLKKLQVQLDLARTNEQRSAQLLQIQGISKSDYDASLLNVNNIRADIDITRANITKTEIRAPFSGKLGLKNISPGSFVTPSTIITTISEVNTLKLQFSIPEKYGAEIKKGQNVWFTVNGSTKTYGATVLATETSIEENTRSLTVRAVVKGHDAELVPGSFANVQMVLGSNANAIMIPISSIIPQGRKKQVFVYKENKAMPMDVTTGVRDSANIQIVSGLLAGDTIITSGLLFLRPGIDVKIAKVNTVK